MPPQSSAQSSWQRAKRALPTVTVPEGWVKLTNSISVSEAEASGSGGVRVASRKGGVASATRRPPGTAAGVMACGASAGNERHAAEEKEKTANEVEEKIKTLETQANQANQALKNFQRGVAEEKK